MVHIGIVVFTMLRSVEDICKEVGTHQEHHHRIDCGKCISKRLYKSTECGISFCVTLGGSEDNPYEDGISLVGYCEGLDWCIPSRKLKFPFTSDEFWSVVELADQDGREMWDETHGCEDCGEEDEYGYIPVRLTCQSCHGYGVIL